MKFPKNQINQFVSDNFRFVGAAVFGVVGLLFFQFLFLPQYRTLQTSGVLEYRDTEQTIEERRQYLQQLEAMQRAYESFDHRLLRYLDDTLPEQYGRVDAFAEIEKLFSGTNLAVQSMNVATIAAGGVATDEGTPLLPSETNVQAPAPQETRFETVLITVNVSVRTSSQTTDETPRLTYSDFKNMLQRIEEQQHLFDIDQLVYTPDASSFTLILKTYQRVQPKDIL